MRPLNHPNIIKFVGVCFEGRSSLKIVLEYAKLGALNKYLKEHKTEMKITQLIQLCHQIALAMGYLASKAIVHRDLAARNVLLLNENTCKVTDFGMSRIMNDANYYYQVKKN
jgi:serine/threonine protein kinase